MLLQFSVPCITATAVRACLENALPGFRIGGDNASFSAVERGSRFIEAMKTRSRSMTNDLACKLALDEPVEPYRFHEVRHRHAAVTWGISSNPQVPCLLAAVEPGELVSMRTRARDFSKFAFPSRPTTHFRFECTRPHLRALWPRRDRSRRPLRATPDNACRCRWCGYRRRFQLAPRLS